MGASETTFTFNIKAVANMEDIVTNVKNIQNALNQLKLSPNLKESFKGTFKNLEKELEKYQNLLSDGIKTKGQASALEKSGHNIIKLYDQIVKKINLINDADLKKAFEGIRTTEIEKMKQKLTELQNQLKTTISTKNLIDTTGAQDSLKKIRSELSKTKSEANKKMAQGISSMLNNGLATFTKNLSLGNLDAAEQALGRLEQKVKDLGNNDVSKVIGNLRNQFNQLKQDSDIKTITENLQNLKSSLSSSEATALQNLVNQFKNGSKEAQELAKSIEQVIQENNKLGKNEASTNTEIESFKNRIKYTLGLANSFYLLRRAVKSAVSTIKELDKAMTETAVVTDMTISDMWAKLPEYTKRANQLGVSTLEAYQAATLYYQQGLNDTQAAELSTETLKMARIAGLKAADATDRMTNALRGFNMELNAINAQKVDDVYSKLAAMSASNVDEISTAMTKVASLAHNANMDFETTAAFLAQIIETTRESAETAGTALKTVVARFTEVKKLVSEDQLKGQDEEGQVIDVNKVSQALRTAGIDLNKYFTGEVGLDDIFMELASKWDSLTSIQQRYIATQAAGSRQQSRFIAMMQDYARTQELVSAAYNANGASAEQFEKTQDSLQSKLARLKNAWDEFLMGITNSSLIKSIVTILTDILRFINNLTTAWGRLNGTVGEFFTGLLRLGAVVVAIRTLKKAFESLAATKILGGIDKLLGGAGLSKSTSKADGTEKTAGTTFLAKVREAAQEFLAKIRQAAAESRQSAAAINAENATENTAENAEDTLTHTQNNAQDTLTHTQNNAQDTLTTQANNAAEITTQTTKSAMELATAEAANRKRLGGSFLPMLGGRSPTPLLGNGSSTSISLGNGWSVLPASGTSGAAISNASGVTAGSFLGQMGAKISGFITKHPIAIAVAALGLEIYGTVKLIQAYNQRYKKRLEKAEKTSKNIQTQSKRIQEQQLKAQEVQKDYSDYTEKVDTAKTVNQRTEAIKDRNDYITSLLEQNAAYAKYIHTTFENGEIVLTLDSDALAAAVDKIAEGALRAKAYASGAEAATVVARQQYYEDQFADKGNGTIIGGLIGHAILGWMGPWGAMLGAILGTVNNTREVNYEKTREDFDTDVEYAAYLRNVQAAQSAEQQSQAYIEQAAAAFVKNENLDDETSNIITTYLGKNFDVRQLQGAIEALTMLYGGSSDAELRKRYANYYGTEADSEMSHEDLVSAVASAAALEMGLGTQVTNLSTLLTGENGEAYKKILSAAVGGADIENIDLSNVNFDGDFSLDDIFGKGFSDSVSKLEETMGLETGALQKQIVEQLKLTQQIQRETKQRIVENSAKAGASLTKDQLTQISKMGPQQARQLEAITSKASGLLDTEGYNDLITKLLSGGLDWSKAQDLLSDIDLSDPINAFLRLEEAINSDDEALANLAKNIKNINSAQLSGSALTQDFINSESYEQLTESLSKFLEKNNEISSTNILELAESNAKLNNLLKTGVITAKALAVALTGIESGTIAVTDLTSSVISALNGLDDLDGAVKRTIDDLNNFDPGYDENDVTSFITKVYEFSKEQMSKGAYGNNQMNQYMAKLFGAFNPAEFPELNYEQAHQAWLQRNLDWLEANSENMSSAWRDLIADAPSEGFSEGVKVWEENGEIFIDAAGHTTDQLIQILSEGSQLTEEQVRMMVADFKNYSDEFAYVMAQNDLPNAVKAWADSLPKNSSGEIFYLDKDLKTLATLLGVDTEDILGILNEYSKGVKELEWGEGTTEDIVKILNTIRGEKAQYAIKENGSYALGEGLINYDDLKKEMDNANLPEYFEQTLNEMVGEGETFTATINGKLEKIEVKAGETAADAYNRTVEEISMENYADAIGMSVAKALADITVNLDTSGAAAKIQALTELLPSTLETSVEINNATAAAIGARAVMESILTRPLDVPISVKPAGASGGTVTGGGKRGPSSTTALSMAGGTSSHKLTPGPALTGEEAPEIVWNKEKGYAYITGAYGPQFQNLKPGDQVFNGQETKKILNNTGRRENLFGSYVNGRKKQTTSTWFIQDEGSGKKVTIEDRTTQASAYGKETLTGPGSGNNNNNNNNNKNNDDWKNDLDWLYDLMEDIAEEEHRQSLIQEEYELSLKDLNKTGKDLYDLTRQELSSLMTQLDAQQFAYEKRLQQMNELQAEVNEKGYQEYVQWNPNDQTLEIDWDKIEDLTDKDTYEAIKGLLSEMEKVQDQMDDAEKSIWDIKKQIQEIQTRYLEKYLDFQQKVLDAVVKNYQDNIDKLNSLNDTIKEANDSILNSIQKEIDLQRQIRDNTKTESDIYDMETRLAYLLRDTSGANQKEIQDLQKQLKESRENYADALIDQSIKRLQDSNSDAVDQREQQIKLLEAQLEYWQETGALWAEVAQLIVDGFTSSGSIIEGSALWEFLKRADSWDGLSEAQKKNWANELILEANEVGAHLIQLSGGIDIDTDKVINSIADINGILTEDISVKLEQVRAILAEIGTLGGTPEHSNHEGYGYSTGGLNTHPGMAMLHGTSTEPEYVLNARQTGAFLRLADVLPSIFGSGTGATNNYGTNVYVELNMSVGEIGSDYDVDRLVARVKDDIYDASSYRNVNAVSFLR